MGQLSVIRFAITIANDVRVSNAQDLRAHKLVGLQMPADWDTATLTFSSSPFENGDRMNVGNDAYQLVFDSDGVALTISAAADTYVVLTGTEHDMVEGLSFARLHSSADQTADREVLGIIAPRG